MSTITADCLPPVEELVVIGAHQLLLHAADPPADFPVELPGGMPSVVPDVLGDALNNWAYEPIPSEPGPPHLRSWHGALGAGLRVVGSSPQEYEAWRREVAASAVETLDWLCAAPVGEAAPVIFGMVFAPVLRRSDDYRVMDAPALAKAAYLDAKARLDRDPDADEWDDEGWEAERAVEKSWDVISALRIQVAEDQWIRVGPWGASWWGNHLCQSVYVGEPMTWAGASKCRISTQTLLVREVEQDTAAVLELLSELNADCGSDALVFDPANRTISSVSDVWLGADDLYESTALLLWAAAAEGMHVAERRYELVAAAAKGTPADDDHPEAGAARRPHPRLQHMTDHWSARKPYQVEPGAFAAIATTRPFDALPTTSGSTGLTSEIPAPGWRGSGPLTALLTLTTDREVTRNIESAARHRLGPGLLARLLLPTTLPSEVGVAVANALNVAEATGPFAMDRLGAWYFQGNSLGYTSFISGEVTYSAADHTAASDVALRIARGCVTRANWAMSQNNVVSHLAP